MALVTLVFPVSMSNAAIDQKHRASLRDPMPYSCNQTSSGQICIQRNIAEGYVVVTYLNNRGSGADWINLKIVRQWSTIVKMRDDSVPVGGASSFRYYYTNSTVPFKGAFNHGSLIADTQFV